MNTGFLGYRGLVPPIDEFSRRARDKHSDDYLFRHLYHFCRWLERQYAAYHPDDKLVVYFVDKAVKLLRACKVTPISVSSLLNDVNARYARADSTVRYTVRDGKFMCTDGYFDAYCWSRNAHSLRKNLTAISDLYRLDEYDEINYDAWTVTSFTDEGFYDDTTADTDELDED